MEIIAETKVCVCVCVLVCLSLVLLTTSFLFLVSQDPKRLFPKANKVATLFVLVIYTLTAIIFYATFEEEYLDLYSFRKGVILFLTPLEDTWVGKMGAFMFGLCLTGSSLVRVLVLTRALHLFVHAKNANSTSVWSAVEWFALSFLIIGLATLLAIAVPDVHILSSVNGALALLVCFILPSCFFLLALRLASGWRLKVLTIEKVGLWIIVILGVIALIMYVIIMTYQVRRRSFDARDRFAGVATSIC